MNLKRTYRRLEQMVARWVHDPKVAGSNPAPATVLVLLLVLTMSSCKLFKPTVVHEHHQTETHYKEILRDTGIVIPGESIQTSLDSIQYQALLSKLERSHGRDTVRIYSRTGTVIQKFYLDSLGELQFECSSMEQKLNLALKEIHEMTSETTTQVERESWWVRNRKYVIIIGINLLLMMVLVVRLLKR